MLAPCRQCTPVSALMTGRGEGADLAGYRAQVDITVNNILAIVNTKLLADYGRLDKRLLHLAYVIKHWAKRRQVRSLSANHSSAAMWSSISGGGEALCMRAGVL